MTVHVPEPKTIEAQSLAQLFIEARTHNLFRDKPVSEELLQKAIELAKMGPTSANQSPMRVLFLRSHAAKERLRPALAPGNLDKTMAAPVVASAIVTVLFVPMVSVAPVAGVKVGVATAGSAETV